jgi:uncharacterized protein (TIGR02284 family)
MKNLKSRVLQATLLMAVVIGTSSFVSNKPEDIKEVSPISNKTMHEETVNKKDAKFLVKAALTGKDRKAILNSCEYGEDVAKSTYEKELEHHAEYLSGEQQRMLKAQHAMLKADHDKVKSVRDALVEA